MRKNIIAIFEWAVIIFGCITLTLAFFGVDDDCLKLPIIISFGIVLYLLIRAIVLFFIRQPLFDWLLINGNFLRKICCFILLMPFVLTGISMIIIGSPKELAYEDNLYECTDQGVPCVIKHKQESPNLFWSTYFHFVDPGNQHMTTTQNGRGWSALIAILGVFLLNGLLVSSIIGWIDSRKEKWQNGSIRYKPRHLGKNKFAVVIGANEIAASVIQNLLTPKEKGKLNFYSEGDNRYVVLQTSRDVQEVRDELGSRLSKEDLKKVIIYKALRDSEEELKQLHIECTTEVYILGETSLIGGGESYHDAINMKCLNMVADILSKSEHQKKLPRNWHRKVCKVLFEYQTTYSIFLFSDIKEDINKYLVFIPFNRCDSWARRVMADGSYCRFEDDKTKCLSVNNDYLPLDGDGIKKDSDAHVHFIVVGMSKMGIAMGVQALLQAHYINYASAEKEGDTEKMQMRRTRLTFIDSNADKDKNFFTGRYQNLFNLVRHRYIDTTCGEDNTIEWNDPMNNKISEWGHLNATKNGQIRNNNLLDVEIEFIKGELESNGVRKYLSEISNNDNEWVKNSKLTIAICLTQTHQAIAASLYMPTSVYEKAQQIWVYQPDAEAIISNLKNTKQGDKRYKKLRAFGMVDRDYMSNRSLYLKSILVNAMYDISGGKKVEGLDEDKIDMGVKDKYREIRAMWKNLTIDKKFSNKYFVDSIMTKVRSIIAEPFTLKELDDAINNENNQEILARCEHNRWNIQQLLLGYSPCPKDIDLEFQKLEKERNTEGAKKKREELRERFAKEKYNCSWDELNPIQQQELTKSEYSAEYYKIPHGIFDKVKEDYKTGENRIHANICSYEHLDVVDSGAKGYDETLNSKIPMFIEKVDLYTPSTKE